MPPTSNDHLDAHLAALRAGDALTSPADASELADHLAGLIFSRPAEVDSGAESVAAFALEHGDPAAAVRVLRARSRARAIRGDLTGALETAEAAAALAMQHNLAIEAARARLTSMHALGELGRFDDALTTGAVARQLLLDAGEPALAARADINLGITHLRRDEPKSALVCLDRARHTLAAEPGLLGNIENSRGEALLLLNEFAAAEAAFRAATRAFAGPEHALELAIAEGNLADLALRIGRLDEALRGFERARRRFEAADAPAHVARILAEQADAELLAGLHRASVRHQREALVLLEAQSLPLEAARARAGEARALLHAGLLDEAARALIDAGAAFDRLEHALGRSRVDLLLAELELARGRPADARRLARHAEDCLAGRRAEVAAARLVVARTIHASGAPDAARTVALHALADAQELHLLPLCVDLHVALGTITAADDPDFAIEHLEAAVDVLERIRGGLAVGRLRGAFHGSRVDAFDRCISARIDRGAPGDAERALELTERARSREILDRVTAGLVVPDEAPDIVERAEAPATERPRPRSRDAAIRPEPLLIELRDAREALVALHARGARDAAITHDPAAAVAWRRALRSRERTLDAIEARLAATDERRPLLARPATFAELHAALRPGEVQIGLTPRDDHVVVTVLGADGVHLERPGLSASALDAILEDLTLAVDAGLRDPDGPSGRVATTRLAELGRRLLDPVADALHAARLVTVIADGPLRTVPWPAVPVGGRALIDRAAVRSLPGASIGRVLAGLLPGDGPALVAGQADAEAPSIDAELEAVARVAGPDAIVLRGSGATVEAVLAAARTARFVHLAGHGRHDPAAPLTSGLRLADRWLTVRDLLHARVRADLVVLSGCETARLGSSSRGLHARPSPGDDFGLSTAFLAAGARSVVSGLWRVRDTWTTEIMDSFHFARHTRSGEARTAESLREAQFAARRVHAHPAAWAGFQLLGAP